MTREEAIHELIELQGGSGRTYEAIRLAIVALRTDPVEVVRCKDCKHKYMKSMGYYCSERVHPLNPEGYCERGEKE